MTPSAGNPSWPACAALAAMLATAPAAATASEVPYLLSLEGPPVTVRYSPGSLDRADHVQRRFGRLVAEIGRKQLGQPLLVVELLTDADWRSSGLPGPFGLPAITTTGTLALPAWGTPGTVALWRGLLDGRLPSILGTPLRGTAEEAASLAAADLVGEVEASRLILARLGLVAGEPWADDLLACSLVVSTLQRHEAVRWPELRFLISGLVQRAEAADEERLWRLRFVAAAERVGAESGKLPAKPLLKLVRKGDGSAVGRLVERYPWLRSWS